MIDKLRLSKFTVFDEFEIKFGRGVHVIIGENGTGKTHLLKAGYACCSGNNSYLHRKEEATDELVQDELSERLRRLYLPIENRLGKLRTYGVGNDTSSEIEAHFSPGGKKAKGEF